MDPSLQQLSQLFQDEDAGGILSALAEMESQQPDNGDVFTVPPCLNNAVSSPPRGQIMAAQAPPQAPTPAPAVSNASNVTGNNNRTVVDNNTASQQQQQQPCTPFYYYKDYSAHPDPDPNTPVTAPGRIPNFPAKMYAILSRPDLQDIVSWLPHGRSWKIHKPREFEVKVIPAYFEHSKFSSFIRQANGWGFRRMISKGPDRNSYYHEMFLRSVPHLLKMMKRPPPSSKPLADASTEPDLGKISQIFPLLETKRSADPMNNNFHQEPTTKRARLNSYGDVGGMDNHHQGSMGNHNNNTLMGKHSAHGMQQQHHHHHHHHFYQQHQQNQYQAQGMISAGNMNMLPTMLHSNGNAIVTPTFTPSNHVATVQFPQNSNPSGGLYGYKQGEYEQVPTPASQATSSNNHNNDGFEPTIQIFTTGSMKPVEHVSLNMPQPDSSVAEKYNNNNSNKYSSNYHNNEDCMEPIAFFPPSEGAGSSSSYLTDVFEGGEFKPIDDSFWLS